MDGSMDEWMKQTKFKILTEGSITCIYRHLGQAGGLYN